MGSPHVWHLEPKLGKMAFFSGRGSMDQRYCNLRLEEQWSDKEDCGTFHVKCGKGVTYSNGRRTANVPIISQSIVYSAKPIPVGGKFQIKILESGNHPLVSDLTNDLKRIGLSRSLASVGRGQSAQPDSVKLIYGFLQQSRLYLVRSDS